MLGVFSAIEISASGLTAERTRMNTIASNLANAQTTRGPDGRPFQRQIVSFESELLRAGEGGGFGGAGLSTVRVADVRPDPTPGQRIHDPGHPDADAQGMVTLPNVNLAYEMVDLITASRAYEANLAVAKNARQMAMKTLEIGK